MDTTFCKILVVDDEMLVRQGIIHLLDWEGEGFQIAGEASNGREALELIEIQRPHIILTDIVMPVMDGEELIRIVKGMYPEIEVIVLSSFSEFEYVRSTFQSGVADYILKPKLEAASLLAVLKKTAQRIPQLQHVDWRSNKRQSADYILDKLVSGYPVEYEAEALQAMFPFPEFVLLLADTGDDHAAISRKEEWLESSIRSLLQSGGSRVAFRRLSPLEGHVRFLFNLAVEEREALMQLAEQIFAAGIRTGMFLNLAVSRTFTELEALHTIYADELLQLLDRRFFLPERCLLVDHGGEVQPGPVFDQEVFAAELNRQEFDQAFTRLSAYVSSMSGRRDMGVSEFKSLLCHSIFQIIGMLLQFHYEARALDDSKYEYFRSIHEARHIRETEERLLQFLQDATECVTKNRGGTPAMQKILLYIDEHYSRQLTLTEVAREFHFNPSYLSNYFTLHNKEGFNEYLNRVRIGKACLLLKESPSLSIAEISSLVGYSDHSYFTRVFRKLMGISPSQYRKG
ncbi:Protein-glutamate methylesterase/protein-glutamine glutaminase [Paenibacillus auburnensis]|uniref:Protein-glutamate methylesterase/protein-glutamine glutaminase n=1 Tax=Paenibacillus auburnensis TaxID=2905649 RepID=A0ABM9CT51_9BACL|nr:response regulator transcription factor [Paenibacillus auburnensis]CAH1221686.1 Protein-glutamate methylesterase/protein-glutamine glutaminase [Paenibacillus auburnensis]